MVATKARERALAALLTEHAAYAQYNEPWTLVPPPPVPRLADLTAESRYIIRGVYTCLGGRPEEFEKARPGGWDMAFETPEGLLLVELDEEQHFTRYRRRTLDLSVPWGQAYRRHCETDESRLVPSRTWGKYWTSPASERFFGEASPPGDFTDVGSPRWRQRAFYDAFKDLLPGRRLARISVYDVAVGPYSEPFTIESILRMKEPSVTDSEVVRAFVTSRIHTA